MNTAFHKVWNSDLYLDAIGSAAVIAANVLIFLFVAVTAVSAISVASSTPGGPEPIANRCIPTQVAVGNYVDQRPGAPKAAAQAECI